MKAPEFYINEVLNLQISLEIAIGKIRKEAREMIQERSRDLFWARILSAPWNKDRKIAALNLGFLIKIQGAKQAENILLELHKKLDECTADGSDGKRITLAEMKKQTQSSSGQLTDGGQPCYCELAHAEMARAKLFLYLL